MNADLEKSISSTCSSALPSWRTATKFAYLLGIAFALVMLRMVPPAPPFSEKLGRATYWQSYETSYFASLRSYEVPVEKVLSAGDIPVIVFGDSAIRGTGAVSADVWTRILERKLQETNPRIRVINYAQNAGDLLAPFLYHYLQKRYPDAYYIVQWPLSSETGVRHPFHFWLTSEIMLRDGESNPACKHSFATVPRGSTSEAENYAFVLASLNILTNYLDWGNWIRYVWLGRVTQTSSRRVSIEPLSSIGESDLPVLQFTPPVESSQNTMRQIFSGNLDAWVKYLDRPFLARKAYFDEIFPQLQRSHLLLLSLDFNPYYAPYADKARMKQWHEVWRQIVTEMDKVDGLSWLSVSSARGEFEENDFMDLGHLTPRGQAKLANKVADKILSLSGWVSPRSSSKP